jgi:hypothetical protein
MPNIPALIRYIDERRIEENGGAGYSFAKALPPNIKDTFFAISCLEMLDEDSRDDETVRFLSSFEHFEFHGAYYAMKCLKLAGTDVRFDDGFLRWCYGGKEEAKPCAIPSTPLIRYLKYEVYGADGSSIFSSPLSALLKRIELGEANPSPGLINSVLKLLSNGHTDIMAAYMALEILRIIDIQGHPILLPAAVIEEVKSFLICCATHKGYVANPTSSSMTLDSTYAGHRIAQLIDVRDPMGIHNFIDSLQNENGGFRRAPFGGISTLESCYLATCILSDGSREGHDRL